MVVITRQLFSPTITLNFFSAGLVFPCHWIKTWAVSFTLRVNKTLHFLDEQTSKVQELAKWFHAAQRAEGPGLFPAHQAALFNRAKYSTRSEKFSTPQMENLC